MFHVSFLALRMLKILFIYFGKILVQKPKRIIYIYNGIIHTNYNKLKNLILSVYFFPTTNSICNISYNLCCCKNKFYEDGRIPTEFCTKYTSCAHKFDALYTRSRRYLYAMWHWSKPECDSIWHITKHGQFEALFCCLPLVTCTRY